MKPQKLLVISLFISLSLCSCGKKKNTMNFEPLFEKKVTTNVSVKAGKEPAVKVNVDVKVNPSTSDFEKEYLFNKDKAIKDEGKKTFNNVTVFEQTSAMTVGWNLGNTFDATGGNGLNTETSWSQPRTTKVMIDGLAATGIKTIRIPVSWHNHIIDRNAYTIDPAWMSRVKQVVDWAIEDGLYVIINCHHDDGDSFTNLPKGTGYYPSEKNLLESQRYLYNVWGQISMAFNNGYDEHLIFETMNEPRAKNTSSEWWYNGDAQCVESAKALNVMNQTALDAIRESGGNNEKRFVMCPALQASSNSATKNTFKMPQDIATGRLILSVHAYSPYSFAMESPGATQFTDGHKKELDGMFNDLKRNFIDKGYGVVIGEYGATNKNNLEERVAWFSYYLSKAHALGIPCCLWDNGVHEVHNNDYSEHYGYYNRTNQTWYFPEITKTLIDTTK